jgi:transglutaminase-like putative cysteine protease
MNEDVVIRLVSWFIKKTGGQTLLSISLLLFIMCSVVLGLAGIVQRLEVIFLGCIAVGGVLTGWWLARTALSDWPAWFLLTGTGGILVIFHSGHLTQPAIAILRTGISLTQPAWPWQIDWTPLLSALGVFWQQTVFVFIHAGAWVQGMVSGHENYDPIIVSLVWGLTIWEVSVWSGWAVRRWRHPLLAALPGGGLLAANLNYAGGRIGFLVILLGATLLLTAHERHIQREHAWQSKGIDYSEDVRLELYMTAAFLSLSILSLAALAPSLSIQPIARYAWQVMQKPNQLAGGVADSLGLKPGQGQTTFPVSIYSASLPRSHLIGSGPELSHEIVMYIQVPDSLDPIKENPDGPGIPLYWRSLTYDIYTGHGWASSATSSIKYRAGQPVRQESLPGYLTIQTSVQGVEDLSGALYSPGPLVTIDQDYQVAWRLPPSDPTESSVISGTLVQEAADALGAKVADNHYSVEAMIPVAGSDVLRSSGANYPPWVVEHYLTLPDTIPDRVLELAHHLTNALPTPYDRARAIEAYLRTYPYTLDLPQPPKEEDIADYFLFSLKRGYCDYYATAMVVLARASGLPARLAIGYARGAYDQVNSRYIITAAEAHSWPEIYFPGYGWISFEPTSGRAITERPQKTLITEAGKSMESPGGSKPTILGKGPNLWIIWPGMLVGFLIVSAFLWWQLDDWRLHHLSPIPAFSVLYRRLRQGGARLSISMRKSETPNEYASNLVNQISSLGNGNRWEALLSPAAGEIQAIIHLYAMTIYAPAPPSSQDQERAIQMWWHLRLRLWLAVLLRAIKNQGGEQNRENKYMVKKNRSR